MQRLLRGRWLYLLLILLAVFLYHYTLLRSGPGPHHGGLAGESDVELHAPEVLMRQPGLNSVWLTLQRKPHLGILLGLLVLTVGVFGILGVGLTLRGLMRGGWREAWNIPTRLSHRWSLGELGRIVMLALFMVSLLPFLQLGAATFGSHAFLDPRVWVPISALLLDGFLLLVILTFAIPKAPSPWQSIGLSRRQMNAASVWIGLRGYITFFPWFFLTVLFIGEICRRFSITPPMNPVHRLLLEQWLLEERRVWVMGLTLILVCLVAPLVEEVVFRGVLFAALRRRCSRLISMAVSGALFAAFHPWIGFLPITLLGCLLAFLYERTGTLLSPIVVHIVHNTLLVGGLILLKFLLQPL